MFRATFPTLNCALPYRLNKIGKNPNLVAHREEDLGSESKTINAVVNALAEQAAHASASVESVSIRNEKEKKKRNKKSTNVTTGAQHGTEKPTSLPATQTKV